MCCGLILLLLLQPFYGPLSGTTRVSRYQKKRSSAHLSWSSSNLCQLLPSTTIHSILPVQFTCLTIFLHNLCPSPLWSTCWSGVRHVILHTFLYPISVFFLQYLAIPSQPVLLIGSYTGHVIAIIIVRLLLNIFTNLHTASGQKLSNKRRVVNVTGVTHIHQKHLS